MGAFSVRCAAFCLPPSWPLPSSLYHCLFSEVHLVSFLLSHTAFFSPVFVPFSSGVCLLWCLVWCSQADILGVSEVLTLLHYGKLQTVCLRPPVLVSPSCLHLHQHGTGALVPMGSVRGEILEEQFIWADVSVSWEIKDVSTNHLCLLWPQNFGPQVGLSLGKPTRSRPFALPKKKKVTLLKDMLLGSLKLELF